jgi:hypothetical protein
MTDRDFEEQEIEAAEREAAAVGGKVDRSYDSPEQRAVREAGGGESEGFEDSERELIEHASHTDQAPAHKVLHDQGAPEERERERVDGDADHEPTSEEDPADVE